MYSQWFIDTLFSLLVREKLYLHVSWYINTSETSELYFEVSNKKQRLPLFSHSGMPYVLCSPPGSSRHGISRQECWSGLPCTPPGDFPDPEIKLASLHWQASSLPVSRPGSPVVTAGSANSLCPSDLECHEVPMLLYVSRLIFPNELGPALFSRLLPCAGRTLCHIPRGWWYILPHWQWTRTSASSSGKENLCGEEGCKLKLVWKMLSLSYIL